MDKSQGSNEKLDVPNDSGKNAMGADPQEQGQDGKR